LRVLTFDSEETAYEVIFEDVNIQNVKHITANDIYARNCTALLDGVGKTIDSVGTKLSNMSEDNRPEHVVVVIMTDGIENSSKEYTRERVKELIEQQQNVYNWTFLFMGANQDSFTNAGNLGIDSYTTTNYDFSGKGTMKAYTASSNYVGKIRTGSVDMSLAQEEQEAETN